MERAGSVDPGLPLVTMGGVVPDGNMCCSFFAAVACVVGMIIALGFELGVLYDYRLRDFKAVTDDTAFAYNGSQCLGYASAGKLEAYYGLSGDQKHFDCGDDAHKNELGRLMSASVHGLYHNKGNNAGQHEMAYKAARHVSGVGAHLAAVTCTEALEALEGVAGMSPRLNRVTCDEIYGTPTQAGCITALAAAAPSTVWSDAAGETAGIAAGKLAAGVAAAKAAASAAGEAQATQDYIVDLATANTAGADPPGADYTTDYTGAADAVTTYDSTNADQLAAYQGRLCPATVDDLQEDTPSFKDNKYAVAIVAVGATATEDTAATTEFTATPAIKTAVETIFDWQLYLQCTLVGGLGNVGPVTTADSLSPVPTASRGGTLGVPLYQHSSTDECLGILEPVITVPPAPYADFNCTKPRQARAKVMYGLRLGWSLYATVPCLILIIFLGVDAIMVAICFYTREMALKEWRSKHGVNAKGFQPPPGVATQLATLTGMRKQRLSLAMVGFLIVIILKALYDWVPWSTGTILPQARGCASDGAGWDTEQTATTLHFLVIILILAVIIILPLSQSPLVSAITPVAAADGANTDSNNEYKMHPETSRLYLWFLIVTLCGIVIIGLEAADGTTFGIAWAQRQLEVSSTADLTLLPVDEAATLVETATTSAVLASVTVGATIALVYARWLFSSYGKLNLILWFVWGGCVLAAFIPLMITWGLKLNLDPDSQDVIEKCNQLNIDSFEKGLCEYRQLVFSIALIGMLGVFAVMWACWFKSAFPKATQSGGTSKMTDVDVDPQTLGEDEANPVPLEKKFRSERIPLLSLRVRH